MKEEPFLEEVERFCVHSGPDGKYSIAALQPGEYAVEFISGAEGLNYVYEAWDNQPTPFEPDIVTIADGEVSGIDAELAEGGQITGKVVSASNGAPLADIEVCAEPWGLDNVEGCAVTGSTGEYAIVGLGTDSYLVSFVGPEDQEFLPQYFDDEPGILEGDTVEVTAGGSTPNVNAALRLAGQITGTVTDAVTHAPLAGVDACAWEASDPGYLGPCGETGATGRYTIRRVPAGVYYVSFDQFGGLPGYAIQWYRCGNGRPATPVTVTSGRAASGIDVVLVDRQASACPASTAVYPPTLLRPKPKIHKCRKGFRRKWVKGKRRCVRVHKKARHRHRRHSAPHRSH